MTIWTVEIKELERLYESIKGHFPDLEKEFDQLIKTQDANVVMLYSRRCLEVIINELCENELKRPRKTEPLKGIIDKLKVEGKVSSHIITSMDHLNSLSSYGTHPKDFDPRQVRQVLNNLTIVTEWYIIHKNKETTKTIEGKTLNLNIKTSDKSNLILNGLFRSEKSIIVLPFANMSPNKQDEYFSDGLTEEIITYLAHLKSLRVISRSTSMVLKGTSKDIKTIGRELELDYVLEGSVRKSENKIRITSQLIDAKTDEHMWAERFDGTLDDIFDVQDQIARKIVDALKLELSPLEKGSIKERIIKNPKAYDLWILAKNEFHKLSKEGIERGIFLIRKALELEGDNAQLYATLGYMYWGAYDMGVLHDTGIFDLMEEYIKKSLDLNPNQTEALHVKGLVLYKKGHLAECIKYSRPAADQGGEATSLFAFLLAEIGKFEKANIYAEKAVAADPLSYFPWFALACVDLFMGQPLKAYNLLKNTRDKMTPGEPFVGWWVAQMAAYAGETKAAYSEFQKIAISDTLPWREFCKLFQLALDKDHQGVVEHLRQSMISEIAKTDEYYPLFIANALVLVNENEEAISWLKRSVDWGFSNYLFLAEYNRFLEPLHNDSHFIKIIDQARNQHDSFTD